MTSNKNSASSVPSLSVERIRAVMSDRSLYEAEHDNFVLDAEDIQWLREHGFLGAVFREAMMVRRSALHSQSLSDCYDETQGDLIDPFIETPIRLQSADTLIFIGNSRDEAKALFEMWNIRNETPYTLGVGGIPEKDARELCRAWEELGNGLKKDFLQFAFHNIEVDKLNADYADDRAWASCLEQYNLSEKTVSRIMDPTYRDIRLTKSAKYWALEFLRTNYRTLLNAQENSSARKRDTAMVDKIPKDVGPPEDLEYSLPLWIAAHPFQVRASPFRKNFSLENLTSKQPTDFCNRESRMALTAYP
ncbi:MAG: hypothetical protein MMC33_009450 [Icmadophila ericetorum]|nr:hypothetical protein [Icmadophila ericetorum]